MDIVRFGLIGYGRVAQMHAQAIRDSHGGTLVSVCGRNAERRNAFAERWNIASRTTVHQMVELDHIDAVIIATPHPQHHDDAISAFSAGCHVLVEKPMALTETECTDMILASERVGKVLSVVSQQRWFPANLRIREAIDSGKLGKPALAQATLLGWRDQSYYDSDPWRGRWDTEGGGVTINQGPHLLDLMHWYMGPVERVFGEWDNVNHPGIEVEDAAVATIRFAGGGMGSILLSNAQKPGLHAQVHIHGRSGASVGVSNSAGSIVTGGKSAASPTNDIWTISGEEALLTAFKQQDEAFFASINPNTYFFSRQIDDFTRSIIEGCRPLVSGEDGRQTVRIIEAIYGSGTDHQPYIFS